MSRSTYKEARISQKERSSLVAELLLEGALRKMESENKALVGTKTTIKEIILSVKSKEIGSLLPKYDIK